MTSMQALSRFTGLPATMPAPVTRRTLHGQPSQQYFFYLPESYQPGNGVLAIIHGAARTPEHYLRALLSVSEASGLLTIAPLFDEVHHADYQRLGRAGRGQRADRTLDACVAEAARLCGADAQRLHLFGFSGGAQFVHRYVMAHPARVARAVAVAAGWYTMPDTRVAYPAGIRASRRLADVLFEPRAFLQVPLTVMVGDADLGTERLRQGPRLNAEQGSTRLARARNWVATMRMAAEVCGLEPRVRLEEVPRINHSFDNFIRHGHLAGRVAEALFDIPASGRAAGPAPRPLEPAHV